MSRCQDVNQILVEEKNVNKVSQCCGRAFGDSSNRQMAVPCGMSVNLNLISFGFLYS